jgi:hypothetical protein
LRFRSIPYVLGAAAVLVLLAAPARAQVKAGGEFHVNTYTTNGQSRPAVAVERDGDFVVTWQSYNQDAPLTFGIFGQRYDRSGTARGAEFQINTYTTADQYGPDVDIDRRGNFVVVWEDLNGQDGDAYGVLGQRYDANGNRRGGEFLVNTYTTASQYWGRVGVAPNGNFVVVWINYTLDPDSEIGGQRFDSAGNRLGAEFVVNTITTGYQVFPSVDVAGDGSFVVAWGGPDADYYGVFAQRFDANGNKVGAEFQVNTYTTDFQQYPNVAESASGNFVVSWQSYTQDGSGYGVFAQRYNASGAPQGGEFQVNAYTTAFQDNRSSASLDDIGTLTVAWGGGGAQDGSGDGAIGRRFSVAGAPRSGDFVSNTFTTSVQDMTSVGMDAVGNFVVAWRSYGQEFPGTSGVFAQRFGGLFPTALRVDTAGNGVWEPNETLRDVRPTWRNHVGVSQAFTGTLSNMTAPTGVTASIADTTADYGTVANNASGECTVTANCYTVSNTIAARPATHIDTSVLESLAPDTQGQQKTWLLHIGDSFTDVPTTNGFYRFIETLLHHSVTGGCGGTNYCPSQATTRDQMSVFVLIAKEGAGYAPPACGTPVFADVPASNPFCRFIEELFRRGVVNGCGGGNYCPTQAVSREQMSVFVLRTLDTALNPPNCTTPMFADVPATSPFCKWIEELARRGVVTGCGGGNYCPTAAVTREQMGVFISATFSLTLYGP